MRYQQLGLMQMGMYNMVKYYIDTCMTVYHVLSSIKIETDENRLLNSTTPTSQENVTFTTFRNRSLRPEVVYIYSLSLMSPCMHG